MGAYSAMMRMGTRTVLASEGKMRSALGDSGGVLLWLM